MLFYILSLITLFIYLLTPKNLLLTPSPSPALISYQNDLDFKLYKKECGSSHIAYSPYLLPQSAWQKMMGDLENHFGDDASLDEEDNKQILSFLSKYSLKHFDTKFQIITFALIYALFDLIPLIKMFLFHCFILFYFKSLYPNSF